MRPTLQAKTVPGSRTTPRGPSRLLSALVALGLVGVIGVLWLAPSGGTDDDATPKPSTFPALCDADHPLDVRGAIHDGPGTLIKARRGCRLTITNSQLSGDLVIEGEDGADVRIEASTLRAKEQVARVGQRSTVTILRSTLEAEGEAIQAEDGARVDASDSALRGRVAGLRLGSDAALTLERVQVTSDQTAIRAGNNLKLTGNQLAVESRRTGLEADASLRATLDESTLSADRVALQAGFDARVELKNGSRLSGGQSALVAGASLGLSAARSKLQGKNPALRAATNATIRLENGAELSGADAALVADGNLDLTLDSASIRATGAAVCSGLNTSLHARNATLSGRDAFRLAAPPKPQVIEATTVKGAKVFDAKNCNPDAQNLEITRLEPERRQRVDGGPPPFDYDAAVKELDRAMRIASNMCHASPGRGKVAVVIPGFAPDGSNPNAKIKNPQEVGTATECVLHYFRQIRVPAYDPSEVPSEMMRVVALKD